MEEEERGRKRRRLALVLCIVAATLAIGIGAALLAYRNWKITYKSMPQKIDPADAVQEVLLDEMLYELQLAPRMKTIG
jgi:cytochrome c-type biogenesis protein CcmE